MFYDPPPFTKKITKIPGSTAQDEMDAFIVDLVAKEDKQQLEERMVAFYAHPPVQPVLTLTPLRVLEDLLKESFIIGEVHSQIGPKNFLRCNFATLKSAGFTVLFMEFLNFDNQDILDRYPTGRELGDRQIKLENILDDLYLHAPRNEERKEWEKNNYKAVVNAAKEAGIRVVGLETCYTNQQQYDYRHMKYYWGEPTGQPLDNYRLRSMNYTAYHIIQRVMATETKGSKFIALMGNNHTRTCEGVLGVADLMGVRAVNFRQSMEFKTQQIVFDVKKEDSTASTSPGDITIKLPTGQDAPLFNSFEKLSYSSELKSEPEKMVNLLYRLTGIPENKFEIKSTPPTGYQTVLHYKKDVQAKKATTSMQVLFGDSAQQVNNTIVISNLKLDALEKRVNIVRDVVKERHYKRIKERVTLFGCSKANKLYAMNLLAKRLHTGEKVDIDEKNQKFLSEGRTGDDFKHCIAWFDVSQIQDANVAAYVPLVM